MSSPRPLPHPDRCFTWRFPVALCTDAFSFIRALRANGTGDAHNTTEFYKEGEIRGDAQPPPPPPPPGTATTPGAMTTHEEESPVVKNERKDVEDCGDGDGGVGGGGNGGGANDGGGGPSDVGGGGGDGGEGAGDGDGGGGGGGGAGAGAGSSGRTAEEPANEAQIQSVGGHIVNGVEQGEPEQDKDGEKSVTMDADDAEGRDPGGGDADPRNHPLKRTALDSFVVQGELGGPGVGPAATTEPATDLSDMMCLPHRSPGGVCAAALTLMSLGLLSVHVSIPKQVVVLDKTAGEMAKNGGVKR